MQDFINKLRGATPIFGSFPSIEVQNNWARFYLVIIAAALLLVIPLAIALIFPLFKKDKLGVKGNSILYAFVTGFFITMALFGFLRESLETSSIYGLASGYSRWSIYGWNILLIFSGLGGGLIFSFLFKVLFKKVITKKIKEDPGAKIYIHDHKLSHDHSRDFHHEHQLGPDHSIIKNKDHYLFENNGIQKKKILEKSDPKLKMVALLLLLVHRIPAGFIIGYSLNSFFISSSNVAGFTSLNVAFLISFILHLIPEEIIFYYRQREMNVPKWKATLISMSLLLLFIPMMLLGVYLGKYINGIWQLKSFAFAFIAGIFFFNAIVEFLPEFYHSHHDKKLTKIVLIVFMVGVLFCAVVLAFHQHGK